MMGLLFFPFALVLFLAASVFWVWMLIDVIKHQKKDKALWIIIVLFGHLLGAVVYYVVSREKF